MALIYKLDQGFVVFFCGIMNLEKCLINAKSIMGVVKSSWNKHQVVIR